MSKMISKKVYEKAQNLDVVKVFENDNRIEFLVGFIVTFHKKAKKFMCLCTGHSVYDIGACAYKLATVLKAKEIPEDIKEEVNAEIDDLK